MAQRTKEKTKKSAGIFTGLFFVGGLVILVLIGISLGKEAYRKRQIQKEIESLEAEIQKTNQENSDLSNLISYLSTQEFQEKEAREKLNLQKENEKMIILRKEAEKNGSSEVSTLSTASAPAQDNSPNWQKWLRFFFEKKS